MSASLYFAGDPKMFRFFTSFQELNKTVQSDSWSRRVSVEEEKTKTERKRKNVGQGFVIRGRKLRSPVRKRKEKEKEGSGNEAKRTREKKMTEARRKTLTRFFQAIGFSLYLALTKTKDLCRSITGKEA